MAPLGLFVATLLAYSLLSRWLVRLSVTPQIVLLAAGVFLAITLPREVRPVFDAELLGLIGEVALVTVVETPLAPQLPSRSEKYGSMVRSAVRAVRSQGTEAIHKFDPRTLGRWLWKGSAS